MFTGIIEERGEVRELSPHRLVVAARTVTVDSSVGASIAVNGCCLTVVENAGGGLTFDLSEETLTRTSLRSLRAGDSVNLERPVTLAARLGGHIVQGHVDGVGTVTAIEAAAEGGASVSVGIPADLLRYVVEKGSITVDGISLTVAGMSASGIVIAVIPHTLAVTTLGTISIGDPVNIEVDVIAKYVERLMEGQGA
ncbi:MAG: riboflavin synthase [Actinomycetota bacterium]|nr:riboflavin synthase [Actinomycetota bacterium]